MRHQDGIAACTSGHVRYPEGLSGQMLLEGL